MEYSPMVERNNTSRPAAAALPDARNELARRLASSADMVCALTNGALGACKWATERIRGIMGAAGSCVRISSRPAIETIPGVDSVIGV
ncbi:MAG: hypothetical protein ACRENP_16205 [Longimicrobiales bacterium]